jgi:hypothetical protein
MTDETKKEKPALPNLPITAPPPLGLANEIDVIDAAPSDSAGLPGILVLSVLRSQFGAFQQRKFTPVTPENAAQYLVTPENYLPVSINGAVYLGESADMVLFAVSEAAYLASRKKIAQRFQERSDAVPFDPTMKNGRETLTVTAE